ncbi:MAG: hypothetical protein NTU47_04225 [Ignavibacteriales bacterium]|nr:hypothetical protein [Ignavibacteriales bacterium]
MDNLSQWLLVLGGILGGVATSVLAYIAWRTWKKQQAKHVLKLFVSIQMNNLQPNEYEEIHRNVSKTIDIIEGLNRDVKVYWFNKKYPSHHIVSRDDINIDEYMMAIDNCDHFLAVIPEKVHSSIFFESGYALAKGKGCYFFTPLNKQVLPSIMEGSSDVYTNAKKVVYDGMPDFIHKFVQLVPHLHLSADGMQIN